VKPGEHSVHSLVHRAPVYGMPTDTSRRTRLSHRLSTRLKTQAFVGMGSLKERL